MNSGIFDNFCGALLGSEKYDATRYKALALDLPGYGHRMGEEYVDLPSLASAVGQDIPENSVVIGWSLGGLIAQYLAIQRSPKVVGIITICSSAKFTADADWQGIAPLILAGFLKQLERDQVRTLKRFLAIQSLGLSGATLNVQTMLDAVQTKPVASKRTLKSGLEILSSADLREHLADIQVPSLRLYGRHDTLVPKTVVSSIQALHPMSEHIVYDKASHAPFISHPDSVIHDMLTFLQMLKKF